MKKLFLSLIVLGCTLSACKKEQVLPTDCSSLTDVKILSDEEIAEACTYTKVYRYKGEIYTVFECCECDMAYMAYDCSNTPLCEFNEVCMIDFGQKAAYLYSVNSN